MSKNENNQKPITLKALVTSQQGNPADIITRQQISQSNLKLAPSMTTINIKEGILTEKPKVRASDVEGNTSKSTKYKVRQYKNSTIKRVSIDYKRIKRDIDNSRSM